MGGWFHKCRRPHPAGAGPEHRRRSTPACSTSGMRPSTQSARIPMRSGHHRSTVCMCRSGRCCSWEPSRPRCSASCLARPLSGCAATTWPSSRSGSARSCRPSSSTQTSSRRARTGSGGSIARTSSASSRSSTPSRITSRWWSCWRWSWSPYTGSRIRAWAGRGRRSARTSWQPQATASTRSRRSSSPLPSAPRSPGSRASSRPRS